MIANCVRCGQPRSTKNMQQAYFQGMPGWPDEPASVYRCTSRSTCRKKRKAVREATP